MGVRASNGTAGSGFCDPKFKGYSFLEGACGIQVDSLPYFNNLCSKASIQSLMWRSAIVTNYSQ